jgi:hypothetical protein
MVRYLIGLAAALLWLTSVKAPRASRDEERPRQEEPKPGKRWDRHFDVLRMIYSSSVEYSKLADTKAGFVVAAVGILFLAVDRYTLNWRLTEPNLGDPLPIARFVALIVALGGVLAALGLVFLVLRPRRWMSQSGSLMSLPDIARHDYAAYSERLHNAEEVELLDELTAHLVLLAKVADEKNRLLVVAFQCLLLGVAGIVMLVLLR